MYNRTKATSVEEYIDLASDPQKNRIHIIRNLIHASAKKIEEKISYDMPAFIYKGKILLYVAIQSKHIGLYALPETNVEFAEELTAFKTGKGSIQFPNNKDLPIDLIRRIIEFRVKHIDELSYWNHPPHYL